jgi:hypothetical protein
MSRYFTNFPTINYQGKEVRNITNRSKIRDDILSDPFIYLPYTISSGEKPETVAQLYYGSVDDTWLVLLANNMTDPYYDWPMSDDEFDQYFIDKYSSFSKRTGYDVIRWGQNENAKDNIVYYYRIIDKTSSQDGSVNVSYLDLTGIEVTDEQLQILRDNGIITINGIQYRLVAE